MKKIISLASALVMQVTLSQVPTDQATAFPFSNGPTAQGQQLISGPAMSNNNQFNGLNYVDQTNINITVNQAPNPFFQGGFNPNQVPYANYFGWCQNYWTQLQMAWSEANMHVYNGQWDSGTAEMRQALNAMANMIKAFPVSPYPQTMIAIVEGAQIANTLRNAILSAQEGNDTIPQPDPNLPMWAPVPLPTGLPNFTGQQAEYLGLRSIFETVQYAFELDTKYFNMSYEECYDGGCYNNFYTPSLPIEFFSSTAKLGGKFLTNYSLLSQYLGTDRVELNVAKAYVKAAKTTLLSSLQRRGLICQIQDLHQLEHMINVILNRPSGVPFHQRVQQVRYLIKNVENQVNNYSSCGSW